ncbi:GDNF family receptor alpha-like [Protopterus annectens]|uniref:GDNF family receptor alpha-like n=1 Tax=Protopterus annectens TaxID=7888 RepID=UPI001CF9BCC0|nr:GDNF family receptor alpha-like [Protopterus annectens]
MKENRLKGNAAFSDIETDCFVTKQKCKDQHYCFVLYKNFKQQCNATEEHCSLQDTGLQCLSAWRELQNECRCPNLNRKRCGKVWKDAANISCIQAAQKIEASVSDDDYNENNKEKNNEYKGAQSCLDMTTLCISDAVCNRHLAPLVKACAETENRCNVKKCQAATQLFYDSAPLNVAQMLVFCDCNPSDTLCHQAKEALHNQACVINANPTPTCLEVIHNCQDNDICRQRYNAFQSKCWGHVTRMCHDDEVCLLTINKRDLICSNDDECKAAYIRTRGTVLQSDCTCRTVKPSEQALCNIFYHLLHNMSTLTLQVTLFLSEATGNQVRVIV